ncbi:MAG: hypothetical protein HYT10_00765 [Candidatus Levybacteria bacterium]|nr:hypothetical protein [Candidatus Levybacteria bacterium]
MAFVKDMVKVRAELNILGHDASVPVGTEPHLTNERFVDILKDNLMFCIENDIMRKNFEEVARHEAVLVLNHKRNKLDGYIGISALMEMAIAHFLKKKIFLYYPHPDYNKVRWAHEVAIMQPIIIHGDLTKIK